MFKRIHVIINPAAGQDRPILGVLNRAFHPAGVDWDVSVTKQAGDGRRFAQEAIRRGVDAVAVYGGDGTIMEVASGLIGTGVPLGIFPGGTANVISVELDIPSDLAEASALVCGQACGVRMIDVGQVQDQYFLIRVGVGFEAAMIEGADRQLKDRLGLLAYAVSGLRALADPQVACYQLTLDGREVDVEGITCMIANAGNLGRTGFTLAPSIKVGDGLLDVVVVRSADLPTILSLAAGVATGNEQIEPIDHWQAREVRVESRPPQIVQVDGEVMGETPVSARVLPQALKVIVPAQAG